MLLFSEAKLLIYAPPKTGTTALHHALAPHADIVLRGTVKHVSVRAAHRRILPLVESFKLPVPEGFAIIREPVDWLHSWYKYRTRLDISDPKSSKHVSFDDFVDAYLQDERPTFASVGQQSRHLAGEGPLAPIHLYAHDQMDKAVDFLNQKLGLTFSLDWINASPEIDLKISETRLQKLKDYFELDYELYNRAVINSHAVERH